MEQTTLRVTGMHCSACDRRIQKVLSRLEGVRRASADHRRAQVHVVFDRRRTSLEAIRAAIEQAGYGVEGTAQAPSASGAPATGGPA